MAKGFYSKIYNINPNDFSDIVKSSSTYTEILRKCGLENKGCNINTVKRRIKFEGINTDHIQKGYSHNKGKVFLDKQISLKDALEKYFILNSKFNPGTIKKLLHRFKLIEYKCYICNINGMWENKPLILQLDHINGDRTDQRLENLRWLCPNCHSQTESFAGRSTKKHYKCDNCNTEIVKGSKLCIKCFGLIKRKVNRPSKDILEREILILPFTKLSKKYGVTDNSVRKWCKSYGILIPTFSKGYWQKKQVEKI